MGTPKNWIPVIGIFVLLSSCQPQEKMKCKVKSIRELSDVPSASGIEYIQNSYYVIGDNVPWIAVLDSSFSQIDRYALGDYSPSQDGILPKADKHDFEAMTEISWKGKSHLLIFGSGSKQPYRFECKMIDLQEKHAIQTFSLQKLYARIQEEAKLDPSELNIEAAAEVNGKLYLFNRGKNKLVVMNTGHFFAFMQEVSTELKLKVYSIDLPEIKDIRAGFSGAAGDEEHNRIIFTASVEDTDDWVKDGEILGSFVGVIDLENLQQHYTPETAQIVGQDKKETFKVESITLVENEGDVVECVLVTDNDGFNSELMTLSIDFR